MRKKKGNPLIFKISIADSYVEYTYDLELTDKYCIREIAEKLFKAYKKVFKEGKISTIKGVTN